MHWRFLSMGQYPSTFSSPDRPYWLARGRAWKMAAGPPVLESPFDSKVRDHEHRPAQQAEAEPVADD